MFYLPAEQHGCHQDGELFVGRERLKVAEEHLGVVEVERKFYKATVEACRQSVKARYTMNGEFQPPPLSARPPNSVDISVHYSFDYAQQVQPSAARPSLLPDT